MNDISYTEDKLINRFKEHVLYADGPAKRRMVRSAVTLFIAFLLIVILFYLGSYLFRSQMTTAADVAQLENARQQMQALTPPSENQVPQDHPPEATEDPSSSVSDTSCKEEEVCIHVAGAVVTPGVYRMSNKNRVHDAIKLAGGLTEDADDSLLNLAAHIKDGMRLYVPRKGEQPPASTMNDESGVGQPDESGSGVPVNINTADLKDLTTIPGIGEKTAQKILDNRAKQGRFSSIEDLSRVAGIGAKKLDSIRPYITVTP